MNHGLSDQVRAQAKTNYVRPALSRGRRSFSIPVKSLLRDLEGRGFPSNHARQVCTALMSQKFLRENDVEIEAIDGPPSKTSTTVVVHYKFSRSGQLDNAATSETGENSQEGPAETPEEWAHRMTGKLYGLMKDEIANLGGAEAYLRWVRGYDEEEAP